MPKERKSTRIALSIRVLYPDVESFVEGYAVNVSSGGMFIQTSRPLPVNTKLDLNLLLEDSTSLIKAKAKVLWIREPTASEPTRPSGMGVRFTKLDEDSQDILDQMLFYKNTSDPTRLKRRARSKTQQIHTLQSEAQLAPQVKEPQIVAGTFPGGSPTAEAGPVTQDQDGLSTTSTGQLAAVIAESALSEAQINSARERALAQSVDLRDLADVEELLQAPPPSAISELPQLEGWLGVSSLPSVEPLPPAQREPVTVRPALVPDEDDDDSILTTPEEPAAIAADLRPGAMAQEGLGAEPAAPVLPTETLPDSAVSPGEFAAAEEQTSGSTWSTEEELPNEALAQGHDEFGDEDSGAIATMPVRTDASEENALIQLAEQVEAAAAPEQPDSAPERFDPEAAAESDAPAVPAQYADALAEPDPSDPLAAGETLLENEEDELPTMLQPSGLDAADSQESFRPPSESGDYRWIEAIDEVTGSGIIGVEPTAADDLPTEDAAFGQPGTHEIDLDAADDIEIQVLDATEDASDDSLVETSESSDLSSPLVPPPLNNIPSDPQSSLLPVDLVGEAPQSGEGAAAAEEPPSGADADGDNADDPEKRKRGGLFQRILGRK